MESTYKVVCSTNSYQAARDSRFAKHHTTRIVADGLSFTKALAVLADQAANYNDDTEYRDGEKEGYYLGDKLLYAIGDARVDLDGYIFEIVDEADDSNGH